MTDILHIAADVADDLSLERPVSLFAAYDAGDLTDRRLRRALTKTCRFLLRYRHWQVCRAEHAFVAVANGDQPGALPVDFDRLVPGSAYDLRACQPVCLVDRIPPLPARTLWDGPRLLIRPPVLTYVSPHAVGATIAFEYVRNAIGTSATGVRLTEFAADTDVALWDAELIHLGMIWSMSNRMMEAKGEDYDAFKGRLDELASDDAGYTDLTFGASSASGDIVATINLPTTAW
jgi:hypothetical protein